MVSIVQIPFYTVRTFWQAKNAAHPKMSGDFLFLRSHEDFAFSGYNEPACIFTVFSTEQVCEVVPSGKFDVFQRKCQLQISIRRSAVAVVFQRNIQTIKVRTSEVLIDNVLVVGDVVEAAGRECLQIYFAVRMAEKTTLIAQILRPIHLDATIGFEACCRRLFHADTEIASDELKQRLPVDAVVKFWSTSHHREAGGFRLPYAFVITPFFVGMYFRELSRPKQNTYA